MKNKNLSKKKETPLMIQRSNKELETKDNTIPHLWNFTELLWAARRVVTIGWDGPDSEMQSIPFSGYLSYYPLNNRFQVSLWK